VTGWMRCSTLPSVNRSLAGTSVWLHGRLDSQPLPWDYSATVVRHGCHSPDLLDLGTGGGEWLAALSYRPPLSVATEAWPPNVAIARARLEPLGVAVVQVQPARDNTGQPVEGRASPLPFADEAFHLVVDRHESFDVDEVARILAPRGWFITQQVDAGNDAEYRALFGMTGPVSNADSRWESWLPDQLERAGLHVVERASAPLVQVIRDVGALAWGLKAIPWMVPEFSIDRYRKHLREIQARIDTDGPITVRQRRFWVRAQKR
jgi:SAM-dependent methyltransferase